MKKRILFLLCLSILLLIGACGVKSAPAIVGKWEIVDLQTTADARWTYHQNETVQQLAAAFPEIGAVVEFTGEEYDGGYQLISKSQISEFAILPENKIAIGTVVGEYTLMDDTLKICVEDLGVIFLEKELNSPNDETVEKVNILERSKMPEINLELGKADKVYIQYLTEERHNGELRKYQYDKYGNLNGSEAPDDTYKYVFVYNGQGEMIYEGYDDYWRKWTYDEVGNPVAEEDSDGWWIKREFDEEGNLVSVMASDGMWYRNTYDTDGNCMEYEDSLGNKKRWTYDHNGNLIYAEYGGGLWEKMLYDELGRCIYWESSAGNWKKTSYDEKGSTTESNMGRTVRYDKKENSETEKYPNGFWTKTQFDQYGNEIRGEDSSGFWWVKTYGENGDVLIHKEASKDKMRLTQYDERGNRIYKLEWDGSWEKAEFDKNGILIREEKSDGSYKKYKVEELK